MAPERAAVTTTARPVLPIAVMMPVAILTIIVLVAGTSRMAAVPLVLTEPGSMAVGPMTV
ncbi:hypothetical protein [Lichenihabitans psoromatis]|uniref:hypothetical protein n=1 Tax=Lichenihabitans psoromatis TaxID=2528642 RepID=UPI001FE22FBB|nr:hypothetical protein [Lichenihabitans psoromatis]